MSEIYDVALSFAGEQRPYVRQLATALSMHGLSVFFDEFREAEMWGKDLGDYLDLIYRKQSRFVVMCVSKEYREKAWTTHERKSALAAAIESDTEKVLPLRFDDTELPGLRSTTAYLDANRQSPAAVAALLIQKLPRVPQAISYPIGIRVWRTVSIRYAEDAFSGQAAFLVGGRWNSQGSRMIYCASSLCLALLETRSLFDVKLTMPQMMAVEARFPAEVRVEHLHESDLPKGWNAFPPAESTRIVGDSWLRRMSSCVLSVPSAVLPSDRNYLLNPAHPDFKYLTVVTEKPFDLR